MLVYNDKYQWRIMERILIIGCSGSGKSTLARALREKLGLPLVHLDQLWWKKGWKNVTREEFDSRLALALNMDQWIIDGNYSRTMEIRLEKCDTIIYLDFSRWTCLWGAVSRYLHNLGKVRPDMPAGCIERLDWDHLKFIWNFNKSNRIRNYTWIGKTKHAKAIVLKNRKEVRRFLETL